MFKKKIVNLPNLGDYLNYLPLTKFENKIIK